MSKLESKPDYSARQQVVRKIYRILSRINCIPPFEDTINFRHLQRLHELHPDWDVDLDCIYRYHICRCLRCKSEGFLCTQHVLDSSNEISSPQSDTSDEGKPFPALNSKH